MVAMSFMYKGSLSSSKSMYNRGLIVQSFNPDIRLVGESKCEDVALLKQCLEDLKSGKDEFNCGEAGTVLRFLMARVSRESGEWFLKGSARLLSRPHQPLIQALQELGVNIEVQTEGIKIVSDGWQEVKHLPIHCEVSSQFASAIILNSWGLPFDLKINLSQKKSSEAYLVMSLMMVQSLGMVIRRTGSEGLFIPKFQQAGNGVVNLEPDFSSCFAIAACAVFAGVASFDYFPEKSYQPDRIFVSILQAMGVHLSYLNDQLTIKKSDVLKPVEVDLSHSPDLFPVLCVLLSRANGDSIIEGIATLQYKESNRLLNTINLLKRLGRDAHIRGDKLVIFGNSSPFNAIGDYGPDNDHRMAMAAQVANMGGAQLNILNKDVVNKSFPEFWQIIEGGKHA